MPAARCVDSRWLRRLALQSPTTDVGRASPLGSGFLSASGEQCAVGRSTAAGDPMRFPARRRGPVLSLMLHCPQNSIGASTRLSHRLYGMPLLSRSEEGQIQYPALVKHPTSRGNERWLTIALTLPVVSNRHSLLRILKPFGSSACLHVDPVLVV